MNTKAQIIAALIVVILQIVFGALVFKYGYDKGYSASDIKSLQGVIDSTEKLTKAADKASLFFNKLMSGQIKANQQTTQDLLNALSTTAHLRVNCVFDDGVMRQIYQAADRADAAAASGIANTMPAGAATNK